VPHPFAFFLAKGWEARNLRSDSFRSICDFVLYVKFQQVVHSIWIRAALKGRGFRHAIKRQQFRGLYRLRKNSISQNERKMDRARMPLGTIREGWLMVLYPPIFTLSLYIRSFSAACLAPKGIIFPQYHQEKCSKIQAILSTYSRFTAPTPAVSADRVDLAARHPEN
jgi:hypothetical protein